MYGSQVRTTTDASVDDSADASGDESSPTAGVTSRAIRVSAPCSASASVSVWFAFCLSEKLSPQPNSRAATMKNEIASIESFMNIPSLGCGSRPSTMVGIQRCRILTVALPASHRPVRCRMFPRFRWSPQWRYDACAPGRTRPDEQGEHNEQRKQLLVTAGRT